MEKTPPIIKFYGAFDHFSRTCELAKFSTVKLYLYVNHVIHASEVTKSADCGFGIFGIFCQYHFVLR